MKQGINTTFKICIDYDLSKIEKIEFIFKQGKVSRTFVYPSENVMLQNENNRDIICIHWTREDTFMFDYKDYVRMDTRIYLKDCIDNPETPIVKIRMNETLFDE